MSEDIEKIGQKRQEWEEKVLKPALDAFRLKESPTKFYTPADDKDFDFLSKVGFPGQYPFTAGTYPTYPYRPAPRRAGDVGAGLVRAASYSGFGTAEDTRDYYTEMQKLGQRAGPNLAFDLPTQCGYDSDNPLVRGDVGKTGVAVDTLKDFEIIYEAFQGDMELDTIASNFTINAPANIIIALTRCLAAGFAKDNIRVNCVAPGLIDTPLVAPIMTEKRIRRVEERVPLKRHGKAEETAYTVLFLASDESSYITGQTIPVDGGLSIQ